METISLHLMDPNFVSQFMHVHTLFLDQWNKIATKQGNRKIGVVWTLKSLK
jgi:hypothetical protein